MEPLAPNGISRSTARIPSIRQRVSLQQETTMTRKKLQKPSSLIGILVCMCPAAAKTCADARPEKYHRLSKRGNGQAGLERFRNTPTGSSLLTYRVLETRITHAVSRHGAKGQRRELRQAHGKLMATEDLSSYGLPISRSAKYTLCCLPQDHQPMSARCPVPGCRRYTTREGWDVVVHVAVGAVWPSGWAGSRPQREAL
jgi:hypothetical protein